MKLNTGDVVFLKSGGPPMTVGNLLNDVGAVVSASWFDGATLNRRVFHTDQLISCVPASKDEPI